MIRSITQHQNILLKGMIVFEQTANENLELFLQYDVKNQKKALWFSPFYFRCLGFRVGFKMHFVAFRDLCCCPLVDFISLVPGNTTPQHYGKEKRVRNHSKHAPHVPSRNNSGNTATLNHHFCICIFHFFFNVH